MLNKIKCHVNSEDYLMNLWQLYLELMREPLEFHITCEVLVRYCASLMKMPNLKVEDNIILLADSSMLYKIRVNIDYIENSKVTLEIFFE